MPKCRTVRHPVIRYRNGQKLRCQNQSGTGIRGSSPVRECSGTGLRYRMPECRFRRHWARCRCPAMSYTNDCFFASLRNLLIQSNLVSGVHCCEIETNIWFIFAKTNADLFRQSITKRQYQFFYESELDKFAKHFEKNVWKIISKFRKFALKISRISWNENLLTWVKICEIINC